MGFYIGSIDCLSYGGFQIFDVEISEVCFATKLSKVDLKQILASQMVSYVMIVEDDLVQNV